MRINIRSRRNGRIYSFDVPDFITVKELKNKFYSKTGFGNFEFIDFGDVLYDNKTLKDYGIEDDDTIIVQEEYYQAGGYENNSYSTNIHAVNKRENIGRKYCYKIKGSSEGTVWGDNIYTDDSNIAKAAVLEGKCQLGQEKIVGIKMIEGKSSYSSASRYGVSSVTYGSWPASYIFTENS